MFIQKEYIIKGESVTVTFAVNSLGRVKTVKGTNGSDAGFRALSRLMDRSERDAFLDAQRALVKASI